MRPLCTTSTPLANRGAASSSALTNIEDCEASTVTEPPSSQPRPCTVSGSRPLDDVMSAPSAASPSSTGCSGRCRAASSPSKLHVAGRERRDRRQETHDGAGQADVDGSRPDNRCRLDPPVLPSPSSIVVPSARSPATIKAVSRLRSGTADGRGRLRQRREDQRPVGHRLRPGHGDSRPHGCVRRPVPARAAACDRG